MINVSHKLAVLLMLRLCAAAVLLTRLCIKTVAIFMAYGMHVAQQSVDTLHMMNGALSTLRCQQQRLDIMPHF